MSTNGGELCEWGLGVRGLLIEIGYYVTICKKFLTIWRI